MCIILRGGVLPRRQMTKLYATWLTYQPAQVHEEEMCLIPMGGVLPRHPQRTLGIGGTAGMVHPSTGTF